MENVTVRLLGGLGNQMFQYAAGRALAIQRGASLSLDATCIELEPHRSYALDAFAIDAKVTRRGKVPMWLYERRDLHDKLAGRRFRSTPCREAHFHYDSAIASAPANPYLIGYWQSEQYFRDFAAQIRDDFRPLNIGSVARSIEARLTGERQTVAVHVRRGDYVSNSVNTELHGVLSAEYYERAANLVAERVDEPHFHVFSDDPQWCERNLTLPGPVTVESSRNEAHEDMYLISCCRHAIIANSSFSWWGSWLGESPDSVIVAPDAWFAGLDHDTRDLLPTRWLRA